MGNIALGIKGEEIAARYLAAKGYEILARRWRCRLGEIDIVCRSGREVVFVEVKTRSGRDFGYPEESVTPAKQSKLRALAWTFMGKFKDADRYRIDVIAVTVAGPQPRLRHLQHAVPGAD